LDEVLFRVRVRKYKPHRFPLLIHFITNFVRVQIQHRLQDNVKVVETIYDGGWGPRTWPGFTPPTPKKHNKKKMQRKKRDGRKTPKASEAA